MSRSALARPFRLVRWLAASTVLVGTAAHAAPLEVMTFNIRYGSIFSQNEVNGWYNLCGPRKAMVLEVIGAEDPDVVGVQEALSFQVNDLTTGLPQMGFYGVGRNDGVAAGEYSGIFYRANRFTELDHGTFWLSETPEVPGTVFPGSGSIRIASWVLLEDAATGASYFVLNTHWDNVSQSSRLQSAELIRAKLDELAQGLPVIVMGDLNANESNAALKELRGDNDPGGRQLLDGYREVHPVVAPDEATFHGFNGTVNGSRIDFVVAEAFFTPTAARIDRTGFTCGYPSDHYPVTVTFDARVGPGAEAGWAPDAPAGISLADPCVPNCTPGCGTVATDAVPAPVRAQRSAGALLLVLGGAVALATASRRRD